MPEPCPLFVDAGRGYLATRGFRDPYVAGRIMQRLGDAPSKVARLVEDGALRDEILNELPELVVAAFDKWRMVPDKIRYARLSRLRDSTVVEAEAYAFVPLSGLNPDDGSTPWAEAIIRPDAHRDNGIPARIDMFMSGTAFLVRHFCGVGVRFVDTEPGGEDVRFLGISFRPAA